uniref:Ant protein n=1 Tax=Cardiosporidium cionae TaxID=476202 RepID=A0A3Q8UBC2_9APIC|nr:Ant protein [Cardiosporidium cionae]
MPPVQVLSNEKQDLINLPVLTRPYSQSAAPSHSALASLSAAVCSSAFLHPLDLIKTRLQVFSATRGAIPHYKGTVYAIWSIYSSEGYRGLYRGLSATVIASGVSWGIFRYLFDFTRNAIHSSSTHGVSKSSPISLYENMVSSIIATIIATSLVHPLWFIKTRMELQSFESKLVGWTQYKGWMHCCKTIYIQEGYHAFYKGFFAALWMAPHSIIQLVLYEELKKRHNISAASSMQLFWPFLWGVSSKFIAASFTYPFQVLRSRLQMLHSPYANYSLLQTIYVRKQSIKFL